MSRRGSYEAKINGKTLDVDGKYVAVPVTFRWHRDNPLAVSLTIDQPARLGPTREWVFALSLLQEVFRVPRGRSVGEGDVTLAHEGIDLIMTVTDKDNRTGILVLQAGAIEYILGKVGLQPIEEEAVLATEIDIFLYGLQHPEGSGP